MRSSLRGPVGSVSDVNQRVTTILLAVLSILDPKVFYNSITSLLLLGIGVSLLFKGIIEKLGRLSSYRD